MKSASILVAVDCTAVIAEKIKDMEENSNIPKSRQLKTFVYDYKINFKFK